MSIEQNEETKIKFKNLLYFIQFNAINLLFLEFLQEAKANNEYGVLPIWKKLSQLHLSYVPSMSVEFSSSTLFSGTLQYTYFLFLIILCFLPKLRWAHLGVFLCLLIKNVCSHRAIGVYSSSIYFIPFLLLSLYPPKEETVDKNRSQLIVAFACMYLFSALTKLTPSYLIGDRLLHDYLLRLSWSEFLTPSISKYVSWIGILLEFMGGCLIFKGIRKIGLLSANLFHFGVSSMIILTYPLAFFGCSLIFLAVSDKQLNKHFKLLTTLAISLPLILSLSTLLAGSGSFHILVHEGLIFVFVTMAFVVTLFLLHKSQLENINYYSKVGAVLPITYLILTLVFDWHEPYGYTQYSGREFQNHILILPLNEVKKDPLLVTFRGRWNSNAAILRATNQFVVILPSKMYADKLLDYFCKSNQQGSYLRGITRNPIPFVYNREIIENQFLKQEEGMCRTRHQK